MSSVISFQQKFKKHLLKYSKSLDCRSPKELYEPIQYILNTDAKHIRPVLCMLTCELYGEKSIKSLDAALSIELFHTFSLIHDDILDNSTLRRGKKTVHHKWNANIAILAGDVLLVECYRLLTNYSAEISHQLNKLLTNASVLICEGQQEDMNFEKRKQVSSEQYIDMIRKKTSVLLGTSLRMGAIIANADIQQQKILYKIGENIGIAFQIMDDYLDTFGKSSIVGKKIGNDILTNKKTFLLTKALEIANNKQRKKLYQIIDMPASQSKIDEMKNLFKEISVDKLALEMANKINQKNDFLFKGLQVNNEKIKQVLMNLSESFVNRIK